MKKWIISLTLATSVLALTACNGANGDVVVKSESGDITKDDLYNAMKDKVDNPSFKNFYIHKFLLINMK